MSNFVEALMDADPLFVDEFFLVNPDNRAFLSDSSYGRAAQRRWRLALASLLVLVVGLVMHQWLRVDHHDFASLPLVAALVAFAVMCRALYRAWGIWRLARGQFLDATVVRSTVARYHRGGGRSSSGGQFLRVTYTFATPKGSHIEDTQSILRNDTYIKPPEPGTPLVVRYVSDRCFRVM